MAPKPIIDLNSIDLAHVEASSEEIRKFNPQRYEMEQLDGITYYDEECAITVGYKDVRADEFWVRGHIPGRPLLPGVLICEAAAQVCSYYFKRRTGEKKFLGFGGLEQVKFRREVVPGDRLILVARCSELTSRRAVFEAQGFVDFTMVFQGSITGMPI